MAITTAQSISGAYSGSGNIAGSIVALKPSGIQFNVRPMGATTIISGINQTYAYPVSTTGIVSIKPGIDPAIIFALEVVLPSSGWIWPVGIC